MFLEAICENKHSLVFSFLSLKAWTIQIISLHSLVALSLMRRSAGCIAFFFSVYCQLMATLLGICSEMMSHLGVLTPGFTVTMVEHIEVLHYTELLNNSFWKHK